MKSALKVTYVGVGCLFMKAQYVKDTFATMFYDFDDAFDPVANVGSRSTNGSRV